MKKHRVAVRRSLKRTAGLAGVSTTLLMSTAALAAGATLLVTGIEMPDSLVAKWLVRPLAAASVATVGSSGGLPTSIGSTTTTTTPGTGTTVKPTKLGINLMEPAYWVNMRPFSNLVLQSAWNIKSGTGEPQSAYLDADGRIIKSPVNSGDMIYIILPRPNGVWRGKSVDIVCKWDGKATVRINMDAAKNQSIRANEARFTYVLTSQRANFQVLTVDPANPLTNLDCREAGADFSQVFNTDYVSFVKRFSLLRFMDWQQTNLNRTVTWATRSRMVGKNLVRGQDGYPVELMIAMANQADSDAWFCIPWNADADYIRKFAEMVKRDLKPGLKVYVEMSNEVWNWAFLASQQASTEGIASGLSTNAGLAQQYRYAERLGEAMDIWKDVFTGQSDRLVRIAAFQAVSPHTVDTILGFRNTASKVDAIASAPYLDYNLNSHPEITANNLAPLFAELRTRIGQHKAYQAKFRAAGVKYGKRVVTYEGGQHVIGDNLELANAIQHDPRMGDVTTEYMRMWQQNSGDLLVLFNDYGPLTRYGFFGLLDDAGQAPGATPKGKAVLLFQASISK